MGLQQLYQENDEFRGFINSDIAVVFAVTQADQEQKCQKQAAGEWLPGEPLNGSECSNACLFFFFVSAPLGVYQPTFPCPTLSAHTKLEVT